MQGMGTTASAALETSPTQVRRGSSGEALQGGESLAELSHDARNMVTALSLYCDLLEEPGVLSSPYRHYAQELKLVVDASRRLVEKLTLLDFGVPSAASPVNPSEGPASRPRGESARPARGQNSARRGLITAPSSSAVEPPSDDRIDNLREELLANRNLLAAIAGPSAILILDAQDSARGVNLSREDLTRVLVNLVKNASESMPKGGSIHIRLGENCEGPDGVRRLILSIEDNGPGIAAGMLETVFEPGCSTRLAMDLRTGWTRQHQGLGLSITRAIIEAAGGRVRAENRMEGGARFAIELPAVAR